MPRCKKCNHDHPGFRPCPKNIETKISDAGLAPDVHAVSGFGGSWGNAGKTRENVWDTPMIYGGTVTVPE